MRVAASILFVLASGHLLLFAEEAAAMNVTSPAFAAGQPIPKKYTCEGDDRSPPLAWSGTPEGTRSFALIVDDPDAPDPAAPKRTHVHWVLYNLPPTAASLADGASSNALPSGAVEGTNDWKRPNFGGPCPPVGRHRYFFKMYALDKMLAVDKPLDKAALLVAMQGHVLAQAELMGTYQKGDQ